MTDILVVDRRGDDRVELALLQVFIKINGALLTHAETQVRKARVQVARRQRQQVRADGRQHAEAKTSGQLPPAEPRDSLEVFHFAQDAAGTAHQFFACAGQHGAAARSLNKLDAKACLHFGDLRRQAWLAHIHSTRSIPELSGVGDRDQVLHLTQGRSHFIVFRYRFETEIGLVLSLFKPHFSDEPDCGLQ